ncbi:MAG TPA: excinuclease ABC subunit C [Thermodesulfobium narugense]|uniref:Excinuclease ABC subunit C n=1 Tax=Thermodesulfobium acidiphilum TaxID=1794699 RepID=A0A2R4VYM4_THEAF|nr:excinuclease ABC subunit UvrC [Thermodesulfobium acidiphilum]AWB09578.1 Excinuclease ABC subunit C [Thermodesulfobium acidiphilum]PMP84698.1 MAG: excinuclease ABC subunit C [Thermodesulfobium narugense]HEM55312.1 excinuclease ABC subunit C [Thermodesulfobium narugense]
MFLIKDLNLEDIPELPGVYMFFSKEKKPLYVGKAINLLNRLRSYLKSKSHDQKTALMLSEARYLDFIIVRNEYEALILEMTLIKEKVPKYNVQLRDNKSYPYIKIDFNEDFPALELFRGKPKDKKNVLYIGPYPDGSNLRNLLGYINNTLPLRKCSKNTFKHAKSFCIRYQMKQCLAPCVGLTNKEDYKKILLIAKDWLSGDLDKVKKDMVKEIERFSNEENFEQAARLRDSLSYIESFSDIKVVDPQGKLNADAIYINKLGDVSLVQVRHGLVSTNIIKRMTNVEQTNLHDAVLFFLYDFYSNIEPGKFVFINVFLDEVGLIERFLQEKWGKKRKIKVIDEELLQDVDLFKKNKSRLNIKYIEILKIAKENLFVKDKINIFKAGFERLSEIFGRKISLVYALDIAHFQGEATVAGLSAADERGLRKRYYRRVRLTDNNIDDYASMDEALKIISKKNIEADILLIDGGLGQLEVALRNLKDSYTTVISLAKGEEIIYLMDKKELRLPKSDYALRALMYLRDEAHRFANEYRKYLLSKTRKP